MFRPATLAAIVATSFATALTSPLAAQDQLPALPQWGTAGDWIIRIDPAVGNGCLADRNFPDGTLLQIGALPERGGGFFGVYNIIWTQIRDGQTGDVDFTFPDGQFAGRGVGDHRGYLQGGQVFFDNENFLDELSRAQEVTVTGRGEGSVTIDLTGSAKAIEALRSCQAEQG